MGRYSIKDLENLTGVKAHTLRIWEKRYDLIRTKRTNTNIRYYDDDDLKFLINIAFLVNHGYRISKVSKMTAEELHEEIKGMQPEAGGHEMQINALILALIDMDEVRFEKVMSGSIVKFGLEYSILNIVYPFLHKLGILWQTQAVNPPHYRGLTRTCCQK